MADEERKRPADRGQEDAGNERREQVLLAIRQGKLSVGSEWFDIARQACAGLLRHGSGRLGAGDLLGLTARVIHVLFARDFLPRSKKLKNEEFALLEGVALEVATRALPSLVRLAEISLAPGDDARLENKVKAWWFRWNAAVHNYERQPNDTSSLAAAQEIWNILKRDLIASAETQIAGAEKGLVLSKVRLTITQASANDANRVPGEQREPSDPPSVIEEVIGQLYELLEPSASGDCGLFFMGEDGIARVGSREVRDKIGKPKAQDLHEGKLSTILDDPVSPDEEDEETHSTLLADVEEPDVLEALAAVELVQELRARLLLEEARATGRADQLAARCFEELESGETELKDVAEREGISQSSLSAARTKLRKRLMQDRLLRDPRD